MVEQGRSYMFEVAARLLRTAHPTSAIEEFHRTLAQTAIEAVMDGKSGFGAEGVQRGGTASLRVWVPAQVAEDERWLWRRSVL